MVSSSSTWLCKCGDGGRRCRQRLLRWMVRLAIQPMWRARRATSAAAATGGTKRAAWCRRCLVCLMMIGSAPAVLLRLPRLPPPHLPLPLADAGPGPLPTMMWLARCAMAATRVPHAEHWHAPAAGIGIAQTALNPFLTIHRCSTLRNVNSLQHPVFKSGLSSRETTA
jgi:hypothetical protein